MTKFRLLLVISIVAIPTLVMAEPDRTARGSRQLTAECTQSSACIATVYADALSAESRRREHELRLERLALLRISIVATPLQSAGAGVGASVTSAVVAPEHRAARLSHDLGAPPK